MIRKDTNTIQLEEKEFMITADDRAGQKIHITIDGKHLTSPIAVIIDGDKILQHDFEAEE